jgi:hypothetical protein
MLTIGTAEGETESRRVGREGKGMYIRVYPSVFARWEVGRG